ncbi:MAG TPA: phosphoribosylformylglycinamidine synthase I [Elusimicrobia bacterium]|nr:MAG: phosphoribosylformylglycinamidine synthase I [Elusimicrobia bacterium GWA2_66_18]HAZ08818.1 phosphoribosylformylglycinamidine synthase I [Elusimicrobiota bacterium]
MNHPKVLVLRAAGVNCELETAGAFAAVGGKPELVHISELRGGKKRLMDYAVLAIPGGFSYGDDVGAGKVLANQIRHTLTDLRQFVRLGRPVIGICNGFQALVKSGILPHSNACDQTASFTVNDSGRFEARWTHLRLNIQSSCLFFKGLPEMIELPVAHGEGKLVLKSPRHLEDLKKNKSIALQYVTEDGKLLGYPHNPNGSIFNIAGLTNPEGNVLGLMPHPERFVAVQQHPNWTRQTYRKQAIGLEMFRNAVIHAR